jgi:McrBC 5-methylcytosine restriction system component
VGVVSASKEGRALTVAVVPKVWRPTDASRHLLVEWETEPAVAVTVFEGDWVTIAGSEEALALASSALDRAGQGLAETDQSVGPLLQRVFMAPAQLPEAVSPNADIARLVNLIALFDHARLQLPEEDAPGLMAFHPLFRVLLHRRFIAAVEPLVRRVRRGYVESEEALLTPRGRISDASVAVYELSREPRLICRFDEYTEATPLLRVIVGALAEVVHSNVPFYVRPIVRDSVSTAIRLARYLSTIPVPERSAAVRLARQTHLTRLEVEWKPALELAVRVLIDASLAQASRGMPTQTLQFEIATDRVWERILEQALLRALPADCLSTGARNVLPDDVNVEPPWLGMTGSAGSRFPDFLLTAPSTGVWCMDAKYKLADGLPEEGDANQIFVYSHLARRFGEPILHCALLYPTSSSTPATSRTLWRRPAADVDLRLAQLTFPSEDDLAGPGSWSSYISRLERQVQLLVGA